MGGLLQCYQKAWKIFYIKMSSLVFILAAVVYSIRYVSHSFLQFFLIIDYCIDFLFCIFFFCSVSVILHP